MSARVMQLAVMRNWSFKTGSCCARFLNKRVFFQKNTLFYFAKRSEVFFFYRLAPLISCLA